MLSSNAGTQGVAPAGARRADRADRADHSGYNGRAKDRCQRKKRDYVGKIPKRRIFYLQF